MAQAPENASPTEEAFKAFERRVSRIRLNRYRRATTSQEEAVALYLWNVALCEALYPALHFFEVALRNATHDALSQHYGKENWFWDPSILTEGRHQQQVQEAIDKLRRDRKGHHLGEESDPRFPKEPGRVVAELSLGFWVNLYSDPYAATLVRAAAASAFPHGPEAVRLRKHQSAVYPRLRAALDLRNRVFHNEPIYHWSERIVPGVAASLKARHTNLREVVSWMCPVQPTFLESLDRFEKVHDAGWEGLFDDVQMAFLVEEERARERQGEEPTP